MALRVEAIGPQQSRVQITSPDGTVLSIDSRDVAIVPGYNFQNGEYYPANRLIAYFSAGTIMSSLEPSLVKEFACLSVPLPTDSAGLNASVRSVSESISKGRWDFLVELACAQREQLGLP